MKLYYCKFDGLPGFPSLELEGLKSVTALIGPNGSGKSSILKAIRFAFDLLNKRTLCDELPDHDGWEKFERVTLLFSTGGKIDFGEFSDYLDSNSDAFLIGIRCDEAVFSIDRIECGAACIEFDRNQTSLSVINDRIKSINQIKTSIDNMVSQSQQIPHQSQHYLSQAQSMRDQLRESEKELIQERVVTATLSAGNDKLALSRERVDDLLSMMSFPSIEYIDASQFLEDGVPKLISQLMRQKKGRKFEFNQYDAAVERLNHLLQADVDFSDVDGRESLHIDGVSHEFTSTGTKSSLSFFGATKLIERNCIVLWDEPENGLHPTRRTRVLELMVEDGRQYVIATHAAEFAPVFSEAGRVFRCIAIYDGNVPTVSLAASPVATRRDAFAALEALGVHPAKTLFTSNVVIWVEGPTELFFYRHWLNSRLQRHGLKEGFHYTFMQYGGALVSYLSAADDDNFLSAFDVLSVCRYPIFIVDSDLREAPDAGQKPCDYLKQGAGRLLRQVDMLNQERPDSSIFEWTSGREVENYLPSDAIKHAMKNLWKECDKYWGDISSTEFQVAQYDAYHETIGEKLISLGIVDIDRENKNLRLAKGRSIWGAGNKVEFMRAALTMDNLSERDLLWDCAKMFDRIEGFVLRKCGIGHGS
ncbi:recF/RecN/SMC N terminal domain protein [Ralstonia insidiosa]|uniref:RecF/RecN/SMC N terminal domain protein n=1 Tax=Ralstonia insidiosa TaxID=190721 RepID=A0AAC9BMR5_9RALS|nr:MULTISPECIES: AAA family ATPase [Ralstonia]ANH76827.1 recF/RecN/SMC N terminal domain protein [Ralstonia insidiosa]EPX99510.1 hypothetical protein C404_02865 [Ralstonia sp. AU12-08]MBY4705154.1 AAA family ATPase [Ralstonia insidiosa]